MTTESIVRYVRHALIKQHHYLGLSDVTVRLVGRGCYQISGPIRLRNQIRARDQVITVQTYEKFENCLARLYKTTFYANRAPAYVDGGLGLWCALGFEHRSCIYMCCVASRLNYIVN